MLIPDRPAPIAPLGRIRFKQPEEAGTHTAAFTDLDINGHVNSIRYLELLLNLYSPELLRRHPVRRVEMAYCLESYHGDRLHLFREDDATNPRRTLFEIRNAEGQAVVRASITLAGGADTAD